MHISISIVVSFQATQPLPQAPSYNVINTNMKAQTDISTLYNYEVKIFINGNSYL